MEIPSSIIIVGAAFIIVMLLFIYTLFGGTIPYIGVSGVINGNPSDNQYSPISQWSSPENISTSTCKGYKFSAESHTTNYGLTTISLGTPSLNRLNSCNPTCPDDIKLYDTPYYCIDEDQINAIQQFHTCDRTVIDNKNVYDYPTSDVLCTKMDGTQAKYGETENFYSYCSASSSKRYCSGTVGTISVGFSQTNNCKIDGKNVNFNCLQNDQHADGSLSAAPCNLSESPDSQNQNATQQFRIILDDSSKQIVTSSMSGTGVKGNKMRIQDRESCDENGNNCKCVYPINSLDTGEGLKLDYCDGEENDIFQGFVWAIIPPTKFPESVFCKDQFAGNDSDINNCISNVNKSAYDSCVSSCQAQCNDQYTSNCVNGCPPGDNSSINCNAKPSGDTDNDYITCVGTPDLNSCSGTCVSSVCTNKRDCYATCQSINDGEGPNIYSKSSSASQQQFIYIGNGLSYTTPIPTKSPTDLYNYIIDNNCNSIKQNIDDVGDPFFTMEKYSIGQKMSYNDSNGKQTCGYFTPCAVNASCADYLTTNYSSIIMNFPLYNTFSKVISAGCDCSSYINKNGNLETANPCTKDDCIF